MARTHSRQAGVALAMCLIMLVLLTLLVLQAIDSGTINLRIARNMQAGDEARATSQQAIEQFISVYANFYPTPTGKPATGYDVNADGNSDYSVVVATPVCKRAVPQVPPRSVDCASGVKSGLHCWDTLWEVQATASDTNTGALQIVTQGVAITFPPAFVPSSVGC